MAQKLFNLSTKDYEHPFDRAALGAVKKIPLLPTVAAKVMNLLSVKWSIIALCGSNYHVTRSACPALYQSCKDVIQAIDLDSMPDIYVEQDYYVNAYTTGIDRTAYIVLSSGAVDRLSEKELQFIVGHEAGHIKSGHVLYHIMCASIGELVKDSALTTVFTAGLPLALQYWNRMSEFTADRAGLLACQNLEQALNVIMKISGLPMKYYSNASLDGFIEQAREFNDRYSGTFDTVVRNLSILGADHPWTVVRAAELIKWVESGEYAKILDKTKGKKCAACGHQVAKEVTICPFCGCNEFCE